MDAFSPDVLPWVKVEKELHEPKIKVEHTDVPHVNFNPNTKHIKREFSNRDAYEDSVEIVQEKVSRIKHPAIKIEEDEKRFKEFLKNRLDSEEFSQLPDTQGVYYPKHVAIARFAKKRPQELLQDETGRIYGKMPENKLKTILTSLPIFNKNHDSILWVSLPKPRKYKNTMGIEYNGRGLYIGQVNTFPQVGSVIKLHANGDQDKKVITYAKVIMYPEDTRASARSTSVMVRAIDSTMV